MSTGAERKQSRLRRNSIVVQLFLRPGSAFRSSGGSPPREFPRRLARNGAAFGSFALIRFLSVRAVSSAGKITMKALPTWRAVQLVRHHRFPLRLPSQDPRKKIRRDSARVAHRANLSPAPSCFLVSGHGDSAIASTPLNWFANVAFCPPARVRAPGDYAMAILPKCPFAQFLRRCLFRPLERSTPAARKQSRLSRNTDVAQLFRRPWPRFRPNLGEDSPETALRSDVSRFFVSFPYGQSSPRNQKPRRRCQRGPSSNRSAMIDFFSARVVDSGGAKTEPPLPKRLRRPTISPRLVCVPPEWRNTAGRIEEKTLPIPCCAREFRAGGFFLPSDCLSPANT